MLGAIAGDMIGSVFEGNPLKSKDFPLFCEDSTFTDDTVLTVAVAHTIRNAVSLGGDSDTMACIAGGIAQAYYEDIPEEIIEEVRKELSDELLDIIDDFCSTYNLG